VVDGGGLENVPRSVINDGYYSAAEPALNRRKSGQKQSDLATLKPHPDNRSLCAT